MKILFKSALFFGKFRHDSISQRQQNSCQTQQTIRGANIFIFETVNLQLHAVMSGTTNLLSNTTTNSTSTATASSTLSSLLSKATASVPNTTNNTSTPAISAIAANNNNPLITTFTTPGSPQHGYQTPLDTGLPANLRYPFMIYTFFCQLLGLLAILLLLFIILIGCISACVRGCRRVRKKRKERKKTGEVVGREDSVRMEERELDTLSISLSVYPSTTGQTVLGEFDPNAESGWHQAVATPSVARGQQGGYGYTPTSQAQSSHGSTPHGHGQVSRGQGQNSYTSPPLPTSSWQGRASYGHHAPQVSNGDRLPYNPAAAEYQWMGGNPWDV